jgi:hypothetical protein
LSSLPDEEGQVSAARYIFPVIMGLPKEKVSITVVKKATPYINNMATHCFTIGINYLN